MTIKEVKEKYRNYLQEFPFKGERKFAVYDYKDGNGKIVVVCNYDAFGKEVIQAVRVRDGKEMITEGRSRWCDNLEDAIDVAGEMMDCEPWE